MAKVNTFRVFLSVFVDVGVIGFHNKASSSAYRIYGKHIAAKF